MKGEKAVRVNISDVARAANVSKATVSNVFSKKRPIGPEVTERVLTVAKELGYYPNHVAVSLSLKKTMVIGLKMPITSDGEMPVFNTKMISGVMQECNKRGYRLLIDTLPLPELDDPTKFTVDPVDGVILLNPRANDVRIERYSQMNIPQVIIGEPNEKSYMPPFVDNNNDSMLEQLGNYLLSLGHSKILFLNADKGMTVAEVRSRGLRKAFQNQGLKYNTDLEFNYEWSKHKSLSSYGYRMVLETYEQMKYTAIIADTDHTAIGAIRAARELGIILPEQLSIAALNNDTTVAQEVNPSLTSMELYPDKLGSQAAAFLFEIMDRTSHINKIIIDSKLIIRESTASIRSQL